MTFVKDLKFGKLYEQITLNMFLQNENDKFTLSSGKFTAYDIINETTGDKYEVKSCRWAYKTGNICIEYQFNNHDSGINSTDSDYYFYYVVNPTSTNVYERVYKIPTDDLRKMIQEQKFHKKQNGGDGWKSKFYLFKEKIFSSYQLYTNMSENIASKIYGKAVKKYESSSLKKTSPVTCIVLTTGKTKFVELYKAEFGSTGDVYMLDIEDEIMKKPEHASLSALKQSDVTMYEAKLFPLAKEHLQNIIKQLKEMRVKKHIIVLCSSNNLKKYLRVKKAFYYTPSKRLFTQIELKAPQLKDYLNYVRTLLSNKVKTFIFNSFEEVYNAILKDLSIEREI